MTDPTPASDALVAELRELRYCQVCGLPQVGASCKWAHGTVLQREVDRLASLLDRARPYLIHEPTCPHYAALPGPCTCGLAGLLAEMDPEVSR